MASSRDGAAGLVGAIDWGLERIDERAKVVAAGLETGVVVEARTTGRQQHGLTGHGDPCGQLDRLVEPGRLQ